jgi:Tol biopolymer transport system component
MRALALALFLLLPLAGASAAPGPLLAYTVPTTSGPFDVVVSQPDGSDRVSLTGGAGLAQDPAWSPEGTRVAFSLGGEIAVANADGTGLHTVTSGVPAGHSRFNPVWSPDGAQIAYLESNGNTGPDSKDVWLVPSAGGTPTRLTTDGGAKVGLAWQPHGSLLSFTQGASVDWALWTLDTGTGTVRKVAAVQPYTDESRAWSPDGARLAFVDAVNRLAVADADGSQLRELTIDNAGPPAWSPDGRSLVVAETHVYTNLPYSRFGYPTTQDVFIVDVASGAQRRLTGWLDPQTFGPASFAATWWPDGSRLFFRTSRSNNGLWQMNADGSCEQPDHAFDSIIGAPLWQPGVSAGGRLDCIDLRVRADIIDATLALNKYGTVQLTLENDGDLPATGVRLFVSAPPPASLELFCNDGTAALSCATGSIPPGQSRTFAVYAKSPKAGVWSAQVSVTADQPNVVADDARTAFAVQVLPCTIVGTWTADVLTGTKSADRICGLPGPDRISGGPGNDYLNGGSGDDTILGGPGHDTILGKGGLDVIFARDGQRDWIDCGTERDIAIVDRLDHVSHCEKILRG